MIWGVSWHSARRKWALGIVFGLGPWVCDPGQAAARRFPFGTGAYCRPLPPATSPLSLQDDLKGRFIRGKGMKRIPFNSTHWAEELPDRNPCGNQAQLGHGKLVWLRTGQSGQGTSGSCTSQLNWPCPSSLSFSDPPKQADTIIICIPQCGEKGTTSFKSREGESPSLRSQRLGQQIESRCGQLSRRPESRVASTRRPA